MKYGKKRSDNRGLTLIELIVAVAISSIVVGAIWQFVLISTRTYESQKTETELQQEVQQTMNQVQNLLIDTDRAIAYYIDDGEDYKLTNSDYESPVEASKRLEVYNDNKVAHLAWDKETQNVVYKEAVAEKANSTNENDWESALLAEGIEELAVDVSQVEKTQVLKVKMTFARNDKTYTATRSIAMRNSILNTGNTGDIYGDDDQAGGNPAYIIIDTPTEELNPRDTWDFAIKEGKRADDTDINDDSSILWTIQGQTSLDTTIDITTGVLVIGLNEREGNEITVIATLEEDRSVNGIYRFTVGQKQPPEIKVKDLRDTAAERGETIGLVKPAGATGCDLVINAICGDKIPIRTTVDPGDCTYSWVYEPIGDATGVEAGVEIQQENDVEQEYLVVEPEQAKSFILKAVAYSKDLGTNEFKIYVNVVPPLPQIVASYTNESGETVTITEGQKLYAGTTVNLKVKWWWPGKESNVENIFGYKNSLNVDHDIQWTAVTNISNDAYYSKEEDVATSTSITLPTSGATSLTVSASSDKYTGVDIVPFTITIDPVKIDLKAYHSTETLDPDSGKPIVTKGSEFTEEELQNVPLYEVMQFVPEFIGGDITKLTWKALIQDLGDTQDPTSTSLMGQWKDIPSDYFDGEKLILNTGKDKINNSYLHGKKVSIKVSGPGGVYDIVTFTVAAVNNEHRCTWNDKTSQSTVKADTKILADYDYLHPRNNYDKSFDLYGFNVSLGDYKGVVEISNIYILKNDNNWAYLSSADYCVLKWETNRVGYIRFTPKKETSGERNTIALNDIKSIYLDVNDAHTKQHVGTIKLDVFKSDYQASNYENAELIVERDALPNASWNGKEYISKEYNFCNYYGLNYYNAKALDENAVPMKYKYEYVLTVGKGFLGIPYVYWKLSISEYNNGTNTYDTPIHIENIYNMIDL